MKKKFLSIFLTAGLLAMAVTGCGSSDGDTTTENTKGNSDAGSAVTENEKADDLSGTITLAGSTSMVKLCEAMSESFMDEYPGITVTVEYTGSGAGLESLSAGSVDIGNSSRHLKDEEKEGGAVENVVAIDGIAVITNKDNKVEDISKEDLAKIYTGETDNWSKLGGANEAVVVIGREAGSGTRDGFEELLDVKDKCNYAQELDSTGAVLAKVASTPGAVGYVSLDVVDDTVIALTIDGAEASEENILSGDYILSRPFVMATKGEISEQSDLVQTWFDYIESESGKEVVSKVGLIIPE